MGMFRVINRTIGGTTLGTGGGGGGDALATPSVTAVQGDSYDPIVLNWSAIPSATSYQVQRSTNPITGFSTIGTPTTATYSDNSHPAGGRYYYRVKAIASGFTDSAFSVVKSAVYIPFNLAAAHPIVVDNTGTIGVDCDFNSIWDAIISISDNSISNQYKILVQEGTGTYDEQGYFNSDIGLNVGIYLKDYIHIIGQGATPDAIKITGPETATPAYEISKDVFHIPATCLVQNIFPQAHNLKYCFHIDYSGAAFSLFVKDVKVEHLGSATGFDDCFGCGMYGDQKLFLINVTNTAGNGFYAHGNQTDVRNLAKHFEIDLDNCDFTRVLWMDCLEYAANVFRMKNCSVDSMVMQTYTGNYDAHPGDPASNTGVKVYTPFEVDDNSVDALSRDSETAAILGTVLDDVSDFN